MNYCRAVALAHGHAPEDVDGMPLADLERLVYYSEGARNPDRGGE